MYRLIDLYCGAGGASMGYARAGFDVTGVDNRPQPHYPFRFILGDALDVFAATWRDYDAAHASPPCQTHSSSTPSWARSRHEDLIPATRAALAATTLPWAIENVGTRSTGLRADLRLCACQFGLAELSRERWFETSPAIYELRPPCYHPAQSVTITRKTGRRWQGKGKPQPYVGLAECQRLMGIDWMTQRELGNAIPPAYTEWLGRRLIGVLDGRTDSSDRLHSDLSGL